VIKTHVKPNRERYSVTVRQKVSKSLKKDISFWYVCQSAYISSWVP